MSIHRRRRMNSAVIQSDRRCYREDVVRINGRVIDSRVSRIDRHTHVATTLVTDVIDARVTASLHQR